MVSVVHVRCAAAVGLWFLAYPGVAQADPIVISSGTIVGYTVSSEAFIDVQGPEFSFTGSYDLFRANYGVCAPCASPVVDLGGNFHPVDSGSGAGTGVIEGHNYPQVYVEFSSGTFTTPTATLTELGASLVDVPFTFTAVMNGYLEGPLDRPREVRPVFTVDLAGSGRASGLFFGEIDENHADGRSFWNSQLLYEFAQPQPVPEPGTLLLVGGTIGALAVRRSLGGRRRQWIARLSRSLRP